MTVFVISRRRVDAFTEDQFAPLMEAEAEEARRLYGDSHLRAIYSMADTPGAILQFECASVEEAKKLMGRLPLCAAGMLDMTFIPVRPYRGFLPSS